MPLNIIALDENGTTWTLGPNGWQRGHDGPAMEFSTPTAAAHFLRSHHVPALSTPYLDGWIGTADASEFYSLFADAAK